MGCCGHMGQEWGGQAWQGRWQKRMEARRARWEAKWAARRGGHPARSSGNRAFDAYRAETLRRLEEEEKEFREFLDRLRFAKDKAEFDEFLANRRANPPATPQEPAA